MFTSNRAVRAFVGLILLVAGVLKGQRAFSQSAGPGLFDSPFLELGFAEFEIIVALWLVSGLFLHASRSVAIFLFFLFTCASIRNLAIGQTSCSCFGSIPVKPIHVLAIDLGSMLVILFSFPPPSQLLTANRMTTRVWVSARRIAIGILLVGSLLVVHDSIRFDRTGNFLAIAGLDSDGKDLAIGISFPGSKEIEFGDDLSVGNWVILLYHHDCPKCERAVTQFTALLDTFEPEVGPSQVALIELPPYCPRVASCPFPFACGRVAMSQFEHIQTPRVVLLASGVIVGFVDDWM